MIAQFWNICLAKFQSKSFEPEFMDLKLLNNDIRCFEFSNDFEKLNTSTTSVDIILDIPLGQILKKKKGVSVLVEIIKKHFPTSPKNMYFRNILRFRIRQLVTKIDQIRRDQSCIGLFFKT